MIEKKWVKVGISVIIVVILVYVMIYVDVVLRARHAYLEGEKYWNWYENPEIKKQVLDGKLQKEKEKLEKKLKENKLSPEEYNRQLEIAKFNHERSLEESSIKYAYVWYQTAVELFSPPQSKWVKLARKKMPLAKEKWKEELQQKGIPFEDYMLE